MTTAKLKERKKNEITYVHGKMKVGADIYKKKVTAPDPTELLNYTVEELDAVLKTPSTKGPQVRSQDSRFIAYGLDTNDTEEVRETYFKIRLLHPRARHIVCCYNLKCNPVDNHILKDFCDDGDTGVGAYILDIMKMNNIEAKAFFIARYPGKMRPETSKFKPYVEAISKLLEIKPHNTVLKCKQGITETVKKVQEKAEKDTTNHDPAKKVTEIHPKRE